MAGPVNHASGTSGATAVGDLVVDITASTVGNSMIVLVGEQTASGATFAVTDNGGNAYTEDASQKVTSKSYAYVFRAPVTTSATQVTITVTGATGYITADVFEQAGLASTPLDVTGVGPAAETDSNAPSIATSTATAQADEIAYAIIVADNGDITLSAVTAGWTTEAAVAASGDTQFSAYQELSAVADTLTYAGTLSTSAYWGGIIVTYKLSASPPPSASAGAWGGGVAMAAGAAWS